MHNGFPDSPARDAMYRQHRQQQRLKIRKRRRMLAVAVGIVALMIVVTWLPKPRSAGSNSAPGTSAVPRARNGRFGGTAARPTPEFAIVSGTDLRLRLPTQPDDVRAIGYHQAYNPKSSPLVPEGDYLEGAAIKDQVARIVATGRKQTFVMYSRGRRSQATSSVDVVMPVGPRVLSPVTGRVRAVVPYKLYGRIDDIRVEIVPDGHPELVVAIVHITDVTVAQGQRVEGGMTPMAVLRPLGIRSQIDEYTGLIEEHVHMQVNPSAPEPAPLPVVAPGRR